MHLAIVKSAFNSEIVNVCIRDSSHLRLLNGRNATFWMKNKDGNVGLISKTINSGTAIRDVTALNYYKKAKTHLPVSPLVAPTTVNFSCFSPGTFLAFRRSKKNSNRLPSSCNATSLNANVGP